MFVVVIEDEHPTPVDSEATYSEMVTKRQLRRALERERRQIARRLEDAVVPNFSGPVLGRANISYELSERTKAVAHGGMGMIARLVARAGLASEIDASLELLRIHHPYHESDHVLNVAYNALCGGGSLDDIEARRQDRVFLDGLGADSLPDPTTAGDFCRRFSPEDVMDLQEAINRARLWVWSEQPPVFFAERAVIDADASIVPTDGETEEGMDIAYNGVWGYSALMVSFANTKEPLYFKLFGANRPSHEGSAELYDRAIALVRKAGFTIPPARRPPRRPPRDGRRAPSGHLGRRGTGPPRALHQATGSSPGPGQGLDQPTNHPKRVGLRQSPIDRFRPEPSAPRPSRTDDSARTHAG
ncbi:MAG: hypothetical protein M0Z46_15290 [Actinomycetota bacterium]|nr:hypothetical protein [Actinomycetota bacterium]